jgi:ribulose-phosphate 3-epimerase
MKVELLPAVLARSEEEFVAKVSRLRDLGLMLHIDVMDGKFVDNVTWAPVERMRELLGTMKFEAHLMVVEPDEVVRSWIAAGASRVYFHAEASLDITATCAAAGANVSRLGIAINPETSTSRLDALPGELARVLVMGVPPGRSGQPFDDRAVTKVRELRAARPKLHLSVDGGVKPANAKLLVEAGADALVAGSALTDAEDPKTAAAEFMGSFPSL